MSRIVDSELRWKSVTPLSQILKIGTSDPEGEIRRVRFSVQKTGLPKNVADCIRVFDSKTNQSREANPKETLKKHERLIFSLPLYVKDQSIRLQN